MSVLLVLACESSHEQLPTQSCQLAPIIAILGWSPFHFGVPEETQVRSHMSPREEASAAYREEMQYSSWSPCLCPSFSGVIMLWACQLGCGEGEWAAPFLTAGVAIISWRCYHFSLYCLGMCSPVCPHSWRWDQGTFRASLKSVWMGRKERKERNPAPLSPPPHIYLSCRFFMKSSMVNWSKSTKSGFPYSGPSSSSILLTGSIQARAPELSVQR